MIGVGSLPAFAQAALLIGVVLFEAIVLYVGYGVAEQALGNRILEQIAQS